MNIEEQNISVNYQFGNYVLKNNNDFDVFCFFTNYTSDITHSSRLLKNMGFTKVEANSSIITKHKKNRHVVFYRLEKDSNFQLRLVTTK